MCQHPWFGYFSTISCTPTTAPFSGERTILANAAEWQLGLHPTADLSHAVAQGMARANTSVSAGHGYSSIKIIALRSPGSCLWGNKRAQKHRKANQAWVMHFRDVVCRFSLLDILNLRYHTYIQTHTHTHTHTDISVLSQTGCPWPILTVSLFIISENNINWFVFVYQVVFLCHF